MDYLDLLNQSCPEFVVEHVLAADPTRERQKMWPKTDANDPDFDPFGRKHGPECHFAVIGYFAKDVGPGSSESWDRGYTGELTQYLKQAPQEIRDDAVLALQRLARSKKPLTIDYFLILRINDLDLRQDLKERYPVLPEPTAVAASRTDRDYLLYLAHLQEPGAFERIAEAMETIKGPQLVLDFLNELFQWKTPGREQIFQRYQDDGRQTSDVNGNPGLAVADWARLFLGLPFYTGPRVHMREDGTPIDFATTPAGRRANVTDL